MRPRSATKKPGFEWITARRLRPFFKHQDMAWKQPERSPGGENAEGPMEKDHVQGLRPKFCREFTLSELLPGSRKPSRPTKE